MIKFNNCNHQVKVLLPQQKSVEEIDNCVSDADNKIEESKILPKKELSTLTDDALASYNIGLLGLNKNSKTDGSIVKVSGFELSSNKLVQDDYIDVGSVLNTEDLLIELPDDVRVDKNFNVGIKTFQQVSTQEVHNVYNSVTKLNAIKLDRLMSEVSVNYNNQSVQEELVTKFIDENNLNNTTVEDILNGFNNISELTKNIGGIFANRQARFMAIEDFTDKLKQNEAQVFLDENHITSISAEELTKKLEDIKVDVSKTGGGFTSSIKKNLLLDSLKSELNAVCFQDTVDKVKDKLDQNIEKSFNLFSFEASFEKDYKEQLKAFVGDIFANDDYFATSLDAFTEREIDTFIDSVITDVHKANPNVSEAETLEIVKATIQERLVIDPFAPLNITDNLMNTHSALLSDEEKAIKADINDIEQDKDPVAIDGTGVDYSKLLNADVRITDISADWDFMDMDTALNSKDMYGVYSKDTSAALIYESLDTLRPQLKVMIEEEFSISGKVFNDNVVDKYLNYFMTETLREAIQAKYHDSLPELYPNTVLSSNATIKELGELLTTKVKNELAEGYGAFGTNWQAQGIDPLLCATSDYFLSAVEIMQKQEMEYKKSGF